MRELTSYPDKESADAWMSLLERFDSVGDDKKSRPRDKTGETPPKEVAALADEDKVDEERAADRPAGNENDPDLDMPDRKEGQEGEREGISSETSRDKRRQGSRQKLRLRRQRPQRLRRSRGKERREEQGRDQMTG